MTIPESNKAYSMKFSEFYEKFWKIKLPDGTLVSPTALSVKEKQVMNKAEELSVPPYVRTWGRGGWKYIVHPHIADALKKNEKTSCQNK